MEEIRQLAANDLAGSLDLSQFAFQYELSPDQREEQLQNMDPEQTWGAFIDGKLASKLTVIPLASWVGGTLFAMGGIAGVATWPEYRRQGLVGKLIHEALRVMKKEGQTLSFLHPFAFAFYRKYGWETYVEYKKYEIRTGQLPSYGLPEGRMVRTTEIGVLNDIYERYARQYNGMLRRDEQWWSTRIPQKKGSFSVYYDGDGQAQGYIHYYVKDRECTIHEMAYVGEAARRALWKFIKDHDSMIDKVLWIAPGDDPLAFTLNDPRVKQEVVPYFMARIVDAELFLKQVPFHPSAAGQTFVLTLTDEHAAWNEGTYLLEIGEDGLAEVTKMELSRLEYMTETVRIACHIRTLTAVMLGYQKPTRLREIGQIECSERDAQVWERSLIPRTTYLSDFF